MSDEAGEKEEWSCPVEVEWIVQKSISMIKIPGVIQRHNDHHDTAHDIDRGDAWFFGEDISRRRGWEDEGFHGEALY